MRATHRPPSSILSLAHALVRAHDVRSSRVVELLDARLGYVAVHAVTEGFEGGRRAAGDEVVPCAP